MKTTLITASIITIFYGLMTPLGYWLVLAPKAESIGLLEVMLSFSFAGLGMLGGVLAILNKGHAATALVLSCVLYAVTAIYQPIQQTGLSAVISLHSDTYLGFIIRCLLATVIILILYKNKVFYEAIT